jgi:hypothetical protein
MSRMVGGLKGGTPASGESEGKTPTENPQSILLTFMFFPGTLASFVMPLPYTSGTADSSDVTESLLLT